jgi:hypothetical protein
VLRCRQSAAGRALCNIYNGGGSLSRKQYGQHARHRNSLIASQTPCRPPPAPPKPVVPPSKARISVPKFCKCAADIHAHGDGKLRCLASRRPYSIIKEELRAAEEERSAQRQPMPQRPLLDDREKGRCAVLMEFRGKLPDAGTVGISTRRLEPPRRQLTRCVESPWNSTFQTCNQERRCQMCFHDRATSLKIVQ